MKILFLINNIGHIGGTERVTSIIANALTLQNLQIDICSIEGFKNPAFPLDSSINVYSLFPDKVKLKKKLPLIIYRLRKKIKSHGYNQIIVVDTVLTLISVPALIGLKVKHIAWEHFNFKIDVQQKANRRIFARKISGKYCDAIITLTQRDMDFWKAYLKDNLKAQIMHIPNPAPNIDIDTFQSPSHSHKTIIAIGRLCEQKGFDLLLEAWHRLENEKQDWHLKIVGDGPDKAKLESMIDTYNLHESVTLIPFQKNVIPLYQSASYYCLSSRFEGLPMVLLEAQACGLPCIAFDCDTGPSEIIKNRINGYLVARENSIELSNALNQAINISANEYLDLVSNSQNRIRLFSSTNILNLWSIFLTA